MATCVLLLRELQCLPFADGVVEVMLMLKEFFRPVKLVQWWASRDLLPGVWGDYP